MVFLFGRDDPKPVSFCVHPGAYGTDEAFLNEDIWRALVKPQAGRVAISVKPFSVPAASHGGKQAQAPWLKSLTCWTRPSADLPGLGIPSQWLDLYPDIFSDVPTNTVLFQSGPRTSLKLVPTRPVPLSEIILVAESKDSYENSRENSEEVKLELCAGSRIFRQGSFISLAGRGAVSPVNGHSTNDVLQTLRVEHRYKVLMTEPVLQGYALPDSTRFIVLPNHGDPQYPQSLINDDLLSPIGSEASSGPPSDSDAEALEIDESFLASAIVGSISQPRSLTLVNGDAVDASFRDGYSDPKVLDRHYASMSRSSSLIFQAELLKSPHHSSLLEQSDPDCSIYLRTTDLSRIGIFNGDWGVVHSTVNSEQRLARIFGLDDVIITNSNNFLQALGSPILMTNISASTPHGVRPSVSIRPSFFGSRNPPIPTARVLTVARVASPYSNDRTYQPLFLRSLKDYFETRIRLVKKGDIIGVGIHTELAALVGEREQEDATENDGLETLLSGGLPFMSKISNGSVFFKVTNLEYDIVDTANSGSPTDHYVAATMGELGCWVDSHVTKVIQTGLEYSRVPDLSSYLSLVTDKAELPPPDSSLLASHQPYAKIRNLVEATLHTSAVHYDLQLSIFLKGSRGIGKSTVTSWVARSLGLHVLEINCFDLLGENDTQTEGTLLARFEKAASCAPCIFLLRHLDALARTTQVLETGKEPSIASVLHESISDLTRNWMLTGYPVLVVGTSSDPDRIPANVLACFKHEIAFETPAETERLDILTQLIANEPCSPDVSLKTVATQTAAMVASDLVNLVTIAQSNSLQRAMRSFPDQTLTEGDYAAAGVALTGSDLDLALSKARASYSESIGAPKIPSVSWDDVGGLANVKSDILDTIQLPLEHPELFANGLKKRSGILLYGPPGTGKTLLAKAVATSCSLNFFSVKGPELLNMYIGESEANVRRVFQRARDAKPCVIFFDELDSVAPKRGNHGDSGGVMDRIVSQLLAELDGMSDGKGGADVFVIGATNRPDLLDPALLRPGRFDRMLYLGVSDNHESQFNILEALTRKFRRNPDLNLMEIAVQCPFNYTGADFYALCSDAMLKAMSRKAEEIETKIAELNRKPPPYKHPHPLTPQYYLSELATAAEIEVLVSRRDFEDALRELVPSVSQSEMAHYAAVQRRFANDTVDAERGMAGLEDSFGGRTTDNKPGAKLDKGKGKAVE